jgi:hypothetical protein
VKLEPGIVRAWKLLENVREQSPKCKTDVWGIATAEGF